MNKDKANMNISAVTDIIFQEKIADVMCKNVSIFRIPEMLSKQKLYLVSEETLKHLLKYYHKENK